MFSGIVQKKVSVVRLERKPGLVSLAVALSDLANGLERGASVSVSGVCLTAVAIENGDVTFDAMDETLAKTTIGLLKEGDLVNVERSVRVGDEVGGHRVSGHIMGMATISKIEKPPNNWIITVQCDASWMEYILPKGFIALDGCSLTVVDVGSDWFTVHLIPETLRITTFGEKEAGAKINLEIDPQTQAIVETVKRYLAQQ